VRPTEETAITRSAFRRAALGVAAAPVLALSLSACGAGSVDSDSVESQVEDQLEQQVGVRPDVECEEDLPEVDATITCALEVDGEDGVYDVTVTTTSVDGDTAMFDAQVADTPR